MMDEKFTVDMVNFLSQSFSNYNQLFAIMSAHEHQRYVEPLKSNNKVVIIGKNIKSLLKLIFYMKKSEKIILHGLYNDYLYYLLAFFGFSRKSYWGIMGGDLYSFSNDSRKKHLLKKYVIKNLKGVIAGIDNDYLVAREVYGVTDNYFSCLGPNNIITENDYVEESLCIDEKCKNIVLGNSADEENNHLFLIDKIKDKVEMDTKVFIPLSYGDSNNADKVSKYAYDKLGDAANPIRDFMSLDDYKDFLRIIDVVVYAHKRQQAFSNLVLLISNGAKVYMDPESSLWDWLISRGVVVLDVNHIGEDFLIPLSYEERKNNQFQIRKYCSFENMYNEWERVFKDK